MVDAALHRGAKLRLGDQGVRLDRGRILLDDIVSVEALSAGDLDRPGGGHAAGETAHARDEIADDAQRTCVGPAEFQLHRQSFVTHDPLPLSGEP